MFIFDINHSYVNILNSVHICLLTIHRSCEMPVFHDFSHLPSAFCIRLLLFGVTGCKITRWWQLQFSCEYWLKSRNKHEIWASLLVGKCSLVSFWMLFTCELWYLHNPLLCQCEKIIRQFYLLSIRWT